MRFIGIIALLAATALRTAAQGGGAPQPETYEYASADSAGDLVIITTSGKRIVVKRDSGQTTFDRPVISSEGTAVAAPAMFPNCCTSYDIPMQLVIYAAGKAHRFKSDQAIFRWGFPDGGTKIVFGQEPVHFGCFVHFELHDIATEELLDEFDYPQPCDKSPDPRPPALPDWLKVLMGRK